MTDCFGKSKTVSLKSILSTLEYLMPNSAESVESPVSLNQFIFLGTSKMGQIILIPDSNVE